MRMYKALVASLSVSRSLFLRNDTKNLYYYSKIFHKYLKKSLKNFKLISKKKKILLTTRLFKCNFPYVINLETQFANALMSQQWNQFKTFFKISECDNSGSSKVFLTVNSLLDSSWASTKKRRLELNWTPPSGTFPQRRNSTW
jgi:hypothetical protein